MSDKGAVARYDLAPGLGIHQHRTGWSFDALLPTKTLMCRDREGWRAVAIDLADPLFTRCAVCGQPTAHRSHFWGEHLCALCQLWAADQWSFETHLAAQRACQEEVTPCGK